jgi:hypothetical protein
LRIALCAAAGGLLLVLAGCAQPPALPGADEAAPQATACPPELPATVRCLGGRDRASAYYLIAMPADSSCTRTAGRFSAKPRPSASRKT